MFVRCLMATNLSEPSAEFRDIMDRCQRELVRRANEIRKALGMRPVKVDRDAERPTLTITGEVSR